MIATKHNLLEAAMQLSPHDRAELAQRLIESLPEGVDPVSLMDPEVRQTWSEEIQRRIEEIDRGQTKLIPGEDVFTVLSAQ